jgi:hypothetical protein
MPTAYRTIADLPAELPVFPLVGAILLPLTTLPLNIFEPRYLRMIDDSLKGERMIGIIQPVGDGGATGSPQGRTSSLREVGCVGRLRSFQELDDGRCLIALGGIARFRPLAEVAPERPYRSFRVDYRDFVADLERGAGESDVDKTRLIAVLKRFLAQRGLKADWSTIERSPTEQLVNGLSVACPFAPEERQALVEAATLPERAALLVTLAEMELASGQSGGGQRVQ